MSSTTTTTMNASIFFLFFISLLLVPPLFSSSSSSSALLAPITKHHSKRQYILSVYLKTPPQPTKLLLDLGASFSWLDCTRDYTSSTYRSIPCNSSLCLAIDSNVCSNCFDPPHPGCSKDSCSFFPENPVTGKAIIGQGLVDSLSLPTTDGSNPGPLSVLPEFVFSCSDTPLLKGLAKGVTGSAGLGRSNFSISGQVKTGLPSPYVFALCLSGSPSAPGVAFFGTGGPYFFLPEIDLSRSLIYTPLIQNPGGNRFTSWLPSSEYFIGVTSIKVNGKTLSINQTLLTVDENGLGGTKLSTVNPYTVLHTSIYNSLTEAFVNESAALNLTAVNPVMPFGVCYDAAEVLSTRVGPAVPTVDLVMQSDDVFWRIFGSNSMVRIAGKDADVWCLGFLDGGTNATTAIVIGGHQMDDNLLQFDVDLKRYEANQLHFIDGNHHVPLLFPEWIHCQQTASSYVEFLAEGGVSEFQKEMLYSNSDVASSFRSSGSSFVMDAEKASYLRPHNEVPFNNFTIPEDHIHIQEQYEDHSDISEPYSTVPVAAPVVLSKQRKLASRQKATAADRRRRFRIDEKLDLLRELLPSSKKGSKASLLDDIIDHIKYLQFQIKDLSRSRLGGEPTSNSFIFLEGFGHYLVQEQMLNEPLEDMIGKLLQTNPSTTAHLLESKGLFLMPMPSAEGLSELKAM